MGAYRICVQNHVYAPSDDTWALVEALQKSGVGGSSVELGAGSGAVSIACSDLFDTMQMYDTNPLAYRNQIYNLRLNDLSHKIRPYLGEGSGRKKVDSVFFNPPYLPDTLLWCQDLEAMGWNGGPDGLRLFLRMLNLGVSRLKPDGNLFFVSTSLQDQNLVRRAVSKYGYSCQQVLTKRLLFEVVSVYRCTKKT